MQTAKQLEKKRLPKIPLLSYHTQNHKEDKQGVAQNQDKHKEKENILALSKMIDRLWQLAYNACIYREHIIILFELEK